MIPLRTHADHGRILAAAVIADLRAEHLGAPDRGFWDRPDFGGHVTIAANGSHVLDRHGEEVAS